MQVKANEATTLSFSSGGYFGSAFGSAEELCQNAERTLRGLNIDFDSMVAIGLSGHMVLPTLARHFDVPFLALRKQGTYTHDDYGIGKYGRGEIGKRWVLVDDFICSGETVRTAKKQVNAGIAYVNSQSGKNFSTEFVGTYCYSKRYNDASPGHFVYPDMNTRKSITAITVDGKEMQVDGEAYSRIRSKLFYTQADNFRDPKGQVISWWKDRAVDFDSTFDLKLATVMLVAAENFIKENPVYDY